MCGIFYRVYTTYYPVVTVQVACLRLLDYDIASNWGLRHESHKPDKQASLLFVACIVVDIYLLCDICMPLFSVNPVSPVSPVSPFREILGLRLRICQLSIYSRYSIVYTT